jgi:hypothetical protein
MLLLTDEKHCLLVCLMVFNATFNNISVIWWRSVLLVEETAVPGENHDLSQVTGTFYHIMLYTSPWSRFEHTTSVVIGTGCIAGCFVVAAQARYTATTKQPKKPRVRGDYNSTDRK